MNYLRTFDILHRITVQDGWTVEIRKRTSGKAAVGKPTKYGAALQELNCGARAFILIKVGLSLRKSLVNTGI